MLNASRLFSNLVSQYVSRYNRIAERFGAHAPRSSSALAATPTIPSRSNLPANKVSAQRSTVASPAAPRQDGAQLVQPRALETPRTNSSQPRRDEYEPHKLSGEKSKESPEKTEPTTYSSSFTNLRYGLKLKFDMQAIERTVRQLSVTRTSETTTTDETLEYLFAGGFGFSADLQLSGIAVNARASSSGPAIAERAAGRYRSQETGHHARELQREAAETGKSLPTDTRQSYQVAVNRFSLRYKTDARFSSSHFSRFQSHVEQLNEQKPDSVEAYTNQAGQLAASAPNEVVGQFFDTVDGYLQNKEEDLIDRAGRYFAMAAESLGLSAEATATAKETVTNRIESFFDSVESSLNTLEGQFNQSVSTGATGSQEVATQKPVSLDAASIPPNTSQPTLASQESEHSLLSDLISALKPDDDRADSRVETPTKPENTKLESELKDSPSLA